MSEIDEVELDPIEEPIPTWDGTTRSVTLTTEGRAVRHALIDSAKAQNWGRTFSILGQDRHLVNIVRPDGTARYAVLHHAAYGGASSEVVARLIALGAWRMLRNAKGEQPIDIARRRGHSHLLNVLEPVVLHDVSPSTLNEIERHFHALIRQRANALIEKHSLRLPELETLRELSIPSMWFPVPGMYGGFRFSLEKLCGHDMLNTSSWCRVVDGSGEEHLISRFGSLLVDSEFV